MAWVQTKYYRDTPSGNDGYDTEGNRDGYAQIAFEVRFNSLSDGLSAAANAPGVPAYWTTYYFEGDEVPFLYLYNKTAERVEDNVPVWKVVCEYRTLTPQEIEALENNANPLPDQENPEFDPPEIEGDFERVSEIIYHNKGRTGLTPITSSAGEVYVPAPEHEVSYPVLVIDRNESFARDVPSLSRQYADAVNTDAWGWGTQAGQCKIIRFTWQRRWKRLENGSYVKYWRTHYEIAWRPDGWKLHLQDVGSYYLENRFNQQTQQTEQVKIPFIDEYGHTYIGNLDGNGGKLADNFPPVFLPAISHYPELPFANLSLPTGA